MLVDLTDPVISTRSPMTQLVELAAEIRAFLVENVSRTGGHLGPNLGVVELTIAMHRVFDSPDDPIIFDTGHQSYVHKLLTGARTSPAALARRPSLTTMTRLRSLSSEMLFSASHVMPPVSAPSPTTATTWRSVRPVRGERAGDAVGPAERAGRVRGLHDVVRALGALRVAGEAAARRAGREKSCRPVSSLCTYDWWPVSKMIGSFGESKTRCSAIVSSTTPRFGPRCPPVRETFSTRNARISAASSLELLGGQRVEIAGS